MKNKDLARDLANKRQRFSIRKLTIGAASVLLGTTLFLGVQTSQVDAASGDAQTEAVTDQKSDTIGNSETKNGVEESAKTGGEIDGSGADTKDEQGKPTVKGTAKNDTVTDAESENGGGKWFS